MTGAAAGHAAPPDRRCGGPSRSHAVLFLGLGLALFVLASCGKKAPPLPPLNRVPVAPTGFAAARRGATVEIRLVVPAANTDGSKPADLSRMDVYALNGPASVTVDDIFVRGAKVGSIPVNPPRDPDEPPEEEQRPRRGAPSGVDQGSAAQLTDEIGMGGPDLPPARSYVAVGFSKRGRRGALSRAAAVSLAPPPAAPGPPAIAYDETAVTVKWETISAGAGQVVGYRVYDSTDAAKPLNDRPLAEAQYVDKRIEWGVERCYAVTAVTTIASLSVESDLSDRVCTTLKDTFPPAAPTGLTAVASRGAISLLWDASAASDLAGYVVLRAVAPSTTLVSATSAPIQETTFTDQVASGTRVTYAVQAIDKAGNISPQSARIEETAR